MTIHRKSNLSPEMNAALDDFEKARDEVRTSTVSPGEKWWTAATRPQRIKLMREMGFGDTRTYAGYRWQDFAPHTREEIDRLKAAWGKLQ